MEAEQGPPALPQCLVLPCSALFPLQVLAPDLIAVALSTQPWGHRQPHGHGNSWHSSNLVSRAVLGRVAQGSRAGGCSFLPSSPSHLQMHSPTALTTFTTAHISASRNHMDCVKHSSEDEDGTRGQQGWMGPIQKHQTPHPEEKEAPEPSAAETRMEVEEPRRLAAFLPPPPDDQREASTQLKTN